MSFVVFYHIFNFDATFLQRFHHLVGLGFVHAWVIGSLCHEERGFNLIYVEHRRIFFHHFLIFHRVAHHGTSIKVGGESDTCQCCITAVTCSVDGNPFRVGYSLLD